MRALAVLLVVTYHIWLGRVSGGVDIFLLISAFLMTLQFSRKVEKGQPLRLVRHWLHLFKRLLPASVTVLIAVLIGTWAFLPPRRWPDVLQQALASLMYFQNWLLADTSVNYYAVDHSGASPLEHFWSLSVQGQVFILWPLIFGAAAVLLSLLRLTRLTRARWTRPWLNYRSLLAVIFTAIFAFSLVYSIRNTASNQTYTYFDTRARLWEFALGSLLALALPYLKVPRAVRVVMGWVGLAGMISCGLILVVDQQFPGFVALWPTLSAAAIIIAGQTESRWGADRLLSSRLLVGMGDNSYALYLWHWPILVIFLVATAQSSVSIPQGLALIAASLLLAYLTTRFIEAPLRRWEWPEKQAWRAGVVVLACGALLAGPVMLWQHGLNAYDAAVAAQPPEDNPGAAALAPGFAGTPSPDAQPIPAPAAFKDEWAGIDGKCTGEWATTDAQLGSCQANQPSGVPAKTIVVLGDSHAQQWLEAISAVAGEHNWKVVALLKSSCRYGATDSSRPQDCNDFNDASRKYVMEHHPDAVMTVATLTHAEAPYETEVPGYVDGVRGFADAGIAVVGIRDNPRFTFNMSDCAQSKGEKAAQCNPPLADSLADSSPMDDYAGKIRNFFPVDMSAFICADNICPAVVGNVYVYKDDNHLTKTYVQTMAPMFNQKLLAATGWK
ncbi:MAG TPA: acyltransferase family protein [Micrococcaceae bacterium]